MLVKPSGIPRFASPFTFSLVTRSAWMNARSDAGTVAEVSNWQPPAPALGGSMLHASITVKTVPTCIDPS
jgi:hypothetical protein